MRSFIIVLAFALTFGAAGARADRPLSRAEVARLALAISYLGCAGGRIEADDDGYEVSDVRCRDGNTYLLTFNRSFDLVEKVED